MSNSNAIWISLPVDDGGPLPMLFDGDPYMVRLADGEELLASYSRDGGFVACDDDGEQITRPGWSCPMPLDNVEAVKTIYDRGRTYSQEE